MVHAAWKTAYEVHSCEMLRGGDCKVSKLVMNPVLYSEEQQFTSMATVGWDTSAQQHLFFSIVHKDQMGHEQKLGSDAMLLNSRGPARSFRLALKEPHPTPNACNYTGPQEMYQAHTGNSFRVMRNPLHNWKSPVEIFLPDTGPVQDVRPYNKGEEATAK